jgi:hypothetical protein
MAMSSSTKVSETECLAPRKKRQKARKRRQQLFENIVAIGRAVSSRHG